MRTPDSVPAAPSAQRLFLALMLGAELGRTLEALVRAALDLPPSSARPGQRLYGGGDLHLTMFFLGGVDAPRRAELEAALAPGLSGLSAPVLTLSKAGAFPDPGAPRILWVGVHEPRPGPLEALWTATHTVCTGLGFLADPRPFSGHVTVARVRTERGKRRSRALAGAVPEEFFQLDPGLPWKPEALSLVRSLPEGGPGAYRVEREFPLSTSGN